jgi:hypothetical protein
MNRPRPFLRAVPDYDDDPDLTPDLDDVMLDVDGDGVPDRVSGGQGSAPGRTVDVRHGDELVPREDDALVPIPADRPAPRATVVATVLAAEDSERKPALPAWASDWLTLRSTVRRAAVYGLHVAAWHVVRLPQHVTVMASSRSRSGRTREARRSPSNCSRPTSSSAASPARARQRPRVSSPPPWPWTRSSRCGYTNSRAPATVHELPQVQG